MIALPCPSCASLDVIRFGNNGSSKTERGRCKNCCRCFTPKPNSRSLTPEKEEAIVRALAQGISQVGIAAPFKVGRDTVRAIRKKMPQG
jgi:transposase-like protein